MSLLSTSATGSSSLTSGVKSLLSLLKLPADCVQTKQNVSFNYDNPQGVFIPVAMSAGDALSF